MIKKIIKPDKKSNKDKDNLIIIFQQTILYKFSKLQKNKILLVKIMKILQILQ